MTDKEIRTVIAALTENHVLLPSTTVAEVLPYTPPEPFKEAPKWLLGELAWQGWQVPIISYLKLLDAKAGNAVTPEARILIIKTMGESTQVYYIGLVIQGVPKLKTVNAGTLVESQTEGLPEALHSKVTIEGQTALIPELRELTHIVEQAAYGS